MDFERRVVQLEERTVQLAHELHRATRRMRIAVCSAVSLTVLMIAVGAGAAKPKLERDMENPIPEFSKATLSTNLHWENSKGDVVMMLGVDKDDKPYLCMRDGEKVSGLHGDVLDMWHKFEGGKAESHSDAGSIRLALEGEAIYPTRTTISSGDVRVSKTERDPERHFLGYLNPKMFSVGEPVADQPGSKSPTVWIDFGKDSDEPVLSVQNKTDVTTITANGVTPRKRGKNQTN